MLIDRKHSICLQTRKGNNIENEQIFESPANEEAFEEGLRKRYGNDIDIRRPATPVYNCHGMVFASRRTKIWKPEEVAKIISDDGYEEISNLNNVRPGDVVVYYSDDGDAAHSAVVIQQPMKYLKNPKVISKWGSSFECIHHLYNCDYPTQNIKYYRMQKRWDGA